MKIAALAPFPFVQLEFGGAERIQNLLTSVQHEIEVFTPIYTPSQKGKFANLNVNYMQVPQADQQGEFDLVVARTSGKLMAQALADYEPDLVILEHPWQVDAIQGQKFLYDAHNNETAMKKLLGLDDSVAETVRVETLALQANHVTYCSEDDALVTDSPTTFIPNGTHMPKLTMKHGFNSNVLFFVGSAHPPNIGAAITLASLAKALPDYHIVIAGQCSKYIKVESANVSVLGHIDAQMLDYLMRTAHAFVNPIAAGSGSSLKVVRALSYGLPVLSSLVGARGYTDACVITKTAQEMFDALGELRNQKTYAQTSDRARGYANQFSWDSVGKRFNAVVESMLNESR